MHMSQNVGKVLQIIGPVLDIQFEKGKVPDLLNAIEISHEGKKVVCEVATQVGDDVVRCIAMSSTDGMSRGMEAVDTGKGITVPVGPETLGRIFNLLGEGNGSILGHRMTIPAGRIVPVDSLLIPTGKLLDVTDTPFDFRTSHTIGERIGATHEQLTCGAGYDHCWVIDRKTEQGIELAARVEEPVTGRTMEVWSDQVGIQFYSGNFFDGSTNGKYGRPLRYRESLALETQKFPDSPNHADFPSTTLRPNERYSHVCIYRFGTN